MKSQKGVDHHHQPREFDDGHLLYRPHHPAPIYILALYLVLARDLDPHIHQDLVLVPNHPHPHYHPVNGMNQIRGSTQSTKRGSSRKICDTKNAWPRGNGACRNERGVHEQCDNGVDRRDRSRNLELSYYHHPLLLHYGWKSKPKLRLHRQKA
jgi:hypothetical protein